MKHYLEMTTEEKEYTLDCAQTFLKWTREDIKDVTKSFFKIGFRLYEARAYKYYEALGYADIETLAEEEFGFKRSTTYGLIQVYEKTCSKYGHNSMDEKYIGYDYSKLLELCKPRYGGDSFLTKIKPTDSVRDIRKYLKFWNEYSQKYSGCPSITLQEWKAQQAIENVPVLPSISSNKTKETKTQETDFDTWLENQPEGTFVQGGGLDNDYKPSAPVQTFGLPTCAETEPTAEPEKPKYNFSTRAGVREFLSDYENWIFWGAQLYFPKTYRYSFKNGKQIYALVRRVYGADCKAVALFPMFMISNNDWELTEISQNNFEKYCAEHKDEL